MRKTRRSDVILELIRRTKMAVKQLDNLQYRRLNKLIMNGGGNEESLLEGSSVVSTGSQDLVVPDDNSSQVIVLSCKVIKTCRATSAPTRIYRSKCSNCVMLP